MELFIILIGMLLLLLLKGFFSGSEIALVNSDKIKLRHEAKQGSDGAKLALRLFRNPEVLLSTTLVGTNLSTIALTTIGTLLMIQLGGDGGEFYAFLIFTPIFLILGEIVPKSIYQQKSDAITPVIIYPLQWASYIFYPIIFIFSRLARLAARMVGAGKSDQTFFITREQLLTLVEQAEHGAALSAFDRGRIRRVIRFAETTVKEAMIPISETRVISHDGNRAEAVAMVRKHGFNRLPVYDGSTNNIIGVVTLSTWDMMEENVESQKVSDMIKTPLYVSPLETIDQLLPQLHRRDDHMAVVVDEFGAGIGIITMEDIVEEVVGEIDVGYHFEEYYPRRQRTIESLGDDRFLVDSRLSISEANETLGTRIPTAEFHTLGGLLLGRMRHIPKEGEYIVESGYRFTVNKATDRAILKLIVEPDLGR
jgi:CBS domain containing-hemolysin-like protein